MAAFAEYGAQRIDLGLVADAGAGAVRLDQVDRHRVDAAALVGAAHGQQFALEAWREQTLGATVGRGADTTHDGVNAVRSEEHTSELQSLMRISYAVFCLKKQKKQSHTTTIQTQCYR